MLGVIMMKKASCMLVVAAMLLIPAKLLFAAVGCDLMILTGMWRGFFPALRVQNELRVIDQKGGPALLAQVEDRLGDKFQGLFEP